ncbi:MAG: dTMP kinase [Methylophilaceae bacterium]|jgi:dTMP kinase
MQGKFITLEGMDGAGKSTHIPFIQNLLAQAGYSVVSTREPGGTELGEKLREILLHDAMHVDTETLLMFAARAEHLQQLILPALNAGSWVLSDRFTDATFAYQSGAKGLNAERVLQLESWVQGQLQPDLTLLFDVPVEISVARLAQARTPDKFERESADFFTRIRNAYLSRANQHPERIVVIDSNQAIHLVEQQIIQALKSVL